MFLRFFKSLCSFFFWSQNWFFWFWLDCVDVFFFFKV